VRWRQVIVLWIVLLGLGGEYWLVERPRRATPEAEATRPRFLAVEADDVREVRISRGGRTVVSRRSAEGWTVIEPVGVSIPSDLIAAFTTALAGAEEIGRMGEADTDAVAFGLDERAGRVEMVPRQGDSVVVAIGETNPPGTAVYARRVGAREVVLIGRNIRFYEDLILQAVAAERAPATDRSAPVGGG
jgi:hypothetical protein